jgi:hypothetical protein
VMSGIEARGLLLGPGSAVAVACGSISLERSLAVRGQYRKLLLDSHRFCFATLTGLVGDGQDSKHEVFRKPLTILTAQRCLQHQYATLFARQHGTQKKQSSGGPTSQAIAFVIDLALPVISNPRPRNLRIDTSNVDESVWIQDP